MRRRPTGGTLAKAMLVSIDQQLFRQKSDAVAFTREELSKILGLYGQFVAAGEWRDYSIDHLKDAAIFSVFRRAAETPLFRIEKRPALASRQGAFAIISTTGCILKRGKDLAQVLKLFDRQRMKLAD